MDQRVDRLAQRQREKARVMAHPQKRGGGKMSSLFFVESPTSLVGTNVKKKISNV